MASVEECTNASHACVLFYTPQRLIIRQDHHLFIKNERPAFQHYDTVSFFFLNGCTNIGTLKRCIYSWRFNCVCTPPLLTNALPCTRSRHDPRLLNMKYEMYALACSVTLVACLTFYLNATFILSSPVLKLPATVAGPLIASNSSKVVLDIVFVCCENIWRNRKT